jgi:hypothetical protein
MIVGKQIILEEIMPENIEKMRVWRNNIQLRQYFREWKDISTDMQEKWYNERGNNSNPKHIYFQIMARDMSLNSEEAQTKARFLIGCCGILNVDWRLRSGELSIFLAPEYHRRGFGKEALNLLIDYAFREVNLHKFWGECYDSNDAIKLYHSVGFKDDGMIRHSWYHNGKYGNSNVFSMLEAEWVQLRDKR